MKLLSSENYEYICQIFRKMKMLKMIKMNIIVDILK